MLYPLKLRPCFRHGAATPWGGNRLQVLFGKEIPDDRTGESLEVSALPGMESVILNGPLAGAPLSQAVEAWGRALTGLDEPGFPLLVKLLDARETLSVQVHPGDAYAKAHEGKLGKSEAWVVLYAPRGAKLVYGVDPKGVPLAQYIIDGRMEEALRFLPVVPGDVLYIPNGLVHALTAGLIVYEIQQSSDVTYRFYDWGRVDKDGNPRQLHIHKALDVTRGNLHPDKLDGATYLTEGGSVTAFISDPHFELTRLNLAGRMPLPAGRMALITAFAPCTIDWPEGSCPLMLGETAIIPAALSDVTIGGHGMALCAATPDPDALRRQLGTRAADVAGLLDENMETRRL